MLVGPVGFGRGFFTCYSPGLPQKIPATIARMTTATMRVTIRSQQFCAPQHLCASLWRTSPREFPRAIRSEEADDGEKNRTQIVLNVAIKPHCEEEATRLMNPCGSSNCAKETHNDHTRGCKVGCFNE